MYKMGFTNNDDTLSDVELYHELLVMVNNKSYQARQQLAAMPDLPCSIVDKLVIDSCPFVRAELAKNPTVKISVLNALANDDITKVRIAVAGNENVTRDILMKFINDPKDNGVHYHLAMSRSTPINILFKLCDFKCTTIKRLLMTNTALPIECREMLYHASHSI